MHRLRYSEKLIFGLVKLSFMVIYPCCDLVVDFGFVGPISIGIDRPKIILLFLSVNKGEKIKPRVACPSSGIPPSRSISISS